jgi:hypothetical protein
METNRYMADFESRASRKKQAGPDAQFPIKNPI